MNSENVHLEIMPPDDDDVTDENNKDSKELEEAESLAQYVTALTFVSGIDTGLIVFDVSADSIGYAGLILLVFGLTELYLGHHIFELKEKLHEIRDHLSLTISFADGIFDVVIKIELLLLLFSMLLLFDCDCN